MKTIITLAATSLVLTACAVGSFPKFPEKVTEQYTVDIRNQPMPEDLQKAIVNLDEIPPMENIQNFEFMQAADPAPLLVRCLKFSIISQAPYQIKYVGLVDLSICNGVTGFKPDDAISVYNWMDDVYEWAKDRKKCFK